MSSVILKKFSSMLLSDLYKSANGLLIHSIYSNHKVALSEVFESVSDLKGYGFIQEADFRIKITDAGIEYLLKRRSRVFTKITEKQSFVDKVSVPQLKKNAFFLPRLERTEGIY